MQPVNTKEFFEFIFGNCEGYLCIVTIDRRVEKKIKQHFFSYPEELDKAIEFINDNKLYVDVYFAPFLTTRKRRKKQDILETPVVWADGDDCPLEALRLPPSAIVRSSPDKYHFYWKFETVQPSDVGETVSKRIAYHHASEGMDRSGWDLTQLLRVPDSTNHKYQPKVSVSNAIIEPEARYELPDFDNEYDPLPEENIQFEELTDDKVPDLTADQILEKYKRDLNPLALDLYAQMPVSDWSAKLWQLECSLLETGLTPGEAFVVAWEAGCNKYKREKRPKKDLWREIQRAAAYVKERQEEPPAVEGHVFRVKPPELLSDAEREMAKNKDSFIERYTNWAKTLGDAASQYHPAGAFVILSSLMCGSVRLPTSFGTVVPNMWFMILADTTLTRKSTAMDIATDMLMEVNDDVLLATDGSIEGLLTALSNRSGKPSLFLRDEITGLIESITKKEYMAGMMETLTKLYDGKHMKRILRKETIDVKDPRFVMFAGGIKNKMLELLDYRHVASGFLPRFIFITAESDITRLKPIGPPTAKNLEERDKLLDTLDEIHQKYVVGATTSTSATTGSGRRSSVSLARNFTVALTDEAWALYNKYEVEMVQFALSSHDPTLLTPMMDRLAKSGLKAATLIAAARHEDEELVVSEEDLIHAFFYVEQWMKHTGYIVTNIGTSKDEVKIQKLLSQVQANPGMYRSHLMQRNFLTAREADQVLLTLEQRGAIRREKRGAKSERLYPARAAGG